MTSFEVPLVPTILSHSHLEEKRKGRNQQQETTKLSLNLFKQSSRLCAASEILMLQISIICARGLSVANWILPHPPLPLLR